MFSVLHLDVRLVFKGREQNTIFQGVLLKFDYLYFWVMCILSIFNINVSLLSIKLRLEVSEK